LKVVVLSKDKKHFSYLFNYQQKTNKWLTSNDPIRNKSLQTHDTSEYYPAGFHIFQTRREARLYKEHNNETVVKVYYKDVLATGIQYNQYVLLRCIVVKQIYVLIN